MQKSISQKPPENGILSSLDAGDKKFVTKIYLTNCRFPAFLLPNQNLWKIYNVYRTSLHSRTFYNPAFFPEKILYFY